MRSVPLSLALAAGQGCLNGHGVRTPPHEAPLPKDLAAQISRRRNDSDAAANPILRRMARGAKRP